MHAYRYPALDLLFRSLRRALRIGLWAGAILAVLEVFRLFILLYRVRPWAGWTFAASVAGLLLYATARAWFRAREPSALYPPLRPVSGRKHVERLTRYALYLAARLKRLGANPAIDPETQRILRQRAYDLEGVTAAHPLHEDLERAIARAEAEHLGPQLDALAAIAEEQGRAKIRAVIEDAIEPPFPLVTPLVVLYHQVTLLSLVADTLLGRPTLREYRQLLRDVWAVMRSGDFFHIGRRLFEGVYANSPPLGRAADDLGQAITCTWLTWSVTQAAIHRCRALTPWDPVQAVEHLDSRPADSLGIVRDTVVADVLPLLRLRIRHSCQHGGDTTGITTESIVQCVGRAVETIVSSLRTGAAEKAARDNRRTLPGIAAEPIPAAAWHRRGTAGAVRTFSERVRYSLRGRNLLDS